MKTPSSDLHLLIQSLTKREENNFRKFAGRQNHKTTSKYLHLFDLLLQQEEYDETAIKMACNGQYSDEHFASEKHRIYGLILRSLSELRKVDTVRDRIRQQTESIRILRSKGLVTQSMSLLERSLSLAREYELFNEIQQLLDIKRIAILSKSPSDSANAIADIIRESQAVRKQMDNYFFFRDIYDQLHAHVRTKFTRKGSATTEVAAALIQPILDEGETRATSFASKKMMLQIRAQYAVLQGRLNEAIVHYRRLMDLWEEHPHQIADSPRAHIILLCNFGGFCLQNCAYSELQQVLIRLEKTRPNDRAGEAEKFQNIYHLRLLRHLNLAEIDAGLALTPEILKGIEEYGDLLNPARILSLYYNLAVLQFIATNYSEANNWLTKILGHKNQDVRQDIVGFAHLLRPIIRYENEEHDDIEKTYFSSRRFLTNHLDIGDFEKILLNTLRALPGSLDMQRSSKLRKLLTQAEALTASQNGKHILGLEEVTCWIEAKLQKRPVAEVYRDHLKKRCDPDSQ